jgi:UDP:flavonoid glycosyltransferase YjiC (YdhE family)
MRVLLVTIGTAGDLVPFLALGKALQARGHDVTILGNGHYQPAIARAGLGLVEVCSAAEHRRRTEQRDRWTLRQSFQEGAVNLLEDLPRVYDAITAHYVPGETVVAAAGLMFGARIAQEKIRLPLATVHLYPMCFRSISDPALWPSWLPRAVPRLLYRWLDRQIDKRLGAGINAFRSRLGLPAVTRVMKDWWHSPLCVLGLFPEWLAPPRADWPANSSVTGFALYDALEPFAAEKELDDFLATGEPPIVFSHSSAVRDARRFFADSVTVARNLKRRAILLTPRAEQIPAPLPSDVRHFPFVPHSRLLPHAAAIVHHGGIGTVAQALTAGIPQLIVPGFLDQPDNARRLRRLGVSATVRPSAYGSKKVSRTLLHLLQSSEVAARCREYAERCRESNGTEKACIVLEGLR